uniref:Putative secreted protein n=1 Tax=Anopheles darlingi TaxID=43151 RepID=A0A2M4DA03_ANODA
MAYPLHCRLFAASYPILLLFSHSGITPLASGSWPVPEGTANSHENGQSEWKDHRSTDTAREVKGALSGKCRKLPCTWASGSGRYCRPAASLCQTTDAPQNNLRSIHLANQYECLRGTKLLCTGTRWRRNL